VRARRHRTRSLLAAVAVCALVAGCGGSRRTHGSGLPARVPATGSRLQSILQENNLLLYTSPQEQYRVMREIKSLGVDVVKVPLIWALVAPDQLSAVAPHLDATDPGSYPQGSWSRYDDLVEEAHHLGLRVYFQLAPPVPRWAIAPNFPHNQGKALGQVPSFRLFNQFVQAVGRRYSGTWHDSQGRVIPRVSEWGIWNEPNWRNWLNPVRLTVGGVPQTSQPMLYRGLVDAAWRALAATGHRSDTILIGETANIGSVTPLQFVRDLYCLSSADQPLTGNAAVAAGCPRSGRRSAFEAQNPGLFQMSGYAHHPYDFDIPPDRRSRVATELSLANIGQLEQTLNGIFAAYGQSRPGGVPIYLTEWGYVTNPPNPEFRTTLAEQATWLNEGEYMMWREPFVRALAQFLLEDVPSPPPGSATSASWLHAFTTGLMFHNGMAKPALAAYRIPIWLPAAVPGPRVAVWGQLRPADHARLQTGTIEFRPTGQEAWRRLSAVSTRSPEGFIFTHVAIPSTGLVRLAWRSPSGSTFCSRSVRVT
jgi:hypothetical protein